MKYEQKIVIDKPLNEVIEKFSDPDSLKHWQEGFIFMKPINGVLGEKGSQNLLKFKMNGREIEMTETILYNELPQKYEATYVAQGVFNQQANYFEEIEPGKTLWRTHNEFRFSGFMKAIGMLMPGAFKKQSKQFMTDFKAFAEEGKSVLDK